MGQRFVLSVRRETGHGEVSTARLRREVTRAVNERGQALHCREEEEESAVPEERQLWDF